MEIWTEMKHFSIVNLKKFKPNSNIGVEEVVKKKVN